MALQAKRLLLIEGSRRFLIAMGWILLSRIGSKHFNLAELKAEAIERGFDGGIGRRAFDIDEEEVISQSLFGGTALNHGQVYIGVVQLGEDHQQGAGLIGVQRKRQRGFHVVALEHWFVALAGNEHKARLVAVVIFDAFFGNGAVEQLSCKFAGNSRHRFVLELLCAHLPQWTKRPNAARRGSGHRASDGIAPKLAGGWQ